MGCQTNALVGYFGEVRPEPCGHCSFCLTQKAATLPPAPPQVDLNSLIDRSGLEKLRSDYSDALSAPRQAARFLCGLSSPALSREKLHKHDWFGALETQRFGVVLEWLSE